MNSNPRNVLHLAILFCAIAAPSQLLVTAFPSVASSRATAEMEGIPSSSVNQPRKGIPDVLAKFPSDPLNQCLRIISTLPAGAAALDAVGRILTPLQQGLADSIGLETTANDLKAQSACADITVVFARGTTEPGNLGLVTGPPFVDALNERLQGKSLAVQGVQYPATFAGFNRNGTDGVPSMSAFINDTVFNCPNTKIVMSGYSQGALVVRSTAESLPVDTMSKINSVVTFGDPRNLSPITGAGNKSMIICHEDDAVCRGGFITVDHLTYAEDAAAAAEFVMQRANV